MAVFISCIMEESGVVDIRLELGKLSSNSMVVRIRLGLGPKVRRKERKNQHIALALASLLTPASVMASVLAFWRLIADFRATGQFPITEGLFSHWQVWMAAAATLQFGSTFLNRYGKTEPELQKTVETPEQELADSGF
jgi:hypothetical protein